MAVTQNLKGTSYPSFKIHKSGPTLYQGSVAPTQSAVNGDLFLQHGSDGALWIYDNGSWGQVGASGTSTDTTTIINSSNSGSQVQQFVLFGETSDGNEHILAPTSAFSIDTTSTTIDSILTTLDTGSTSGVIGIPANSAGMFEVRIVARDAANNNNAGYKCTGVIVNDNGTTTLLADPTESIIGESNSEWYAVCESQDNGNDSLIIKVSGSANTTVRWTAFVTLTLVNHVTPTYALSASSNSIDEGGTVDITLTTTSLADGMTAAYTVTGVDANDLSAGNLTGVFTINSNSAIASFTLAEDVTTEGAETLTLALDNGLASIDVVVNDTSGTPTYTLSADNTTINEGDTVTFTLTTTNVADSTTVAYTVTGVDADDLSAGSLTGNFTISGGTGTAVFTLAEDTTTEGQEVMTLTLDNGEDALDVVITDTSLNAPSTPEGYSPPLTLTPTSNGGTTGVFIGEDDHSVATNNNYALVTESMSSAYDGSTYVKWAGWCYLFDMNTGDVVKSWNPLFDGDHNDDGSLAAWTPGGTFTQSSKYHTAQCGRSTAINSDYAFVSAVFSGYTQSAGAYVFAYRLSDYSIAKVFRLADIPNVLPDDGNGASANTDFGYYSMRATENWLVVPATRVSTPGGSTNDPATSEQEGAIFIYDISDADPANWSLAKHIENPVPDSARSIGPAGWWGSFGQISHISESGSFMYVNKGGRSYKYNLTNGTWDSNPVTMWSADPHSNTNYNPTDLDDVYNDADHSKLEGNILYWADRNGDVVKAYNLDTETLLWTSATYDLPRSIDLSDDHVYVQARDGTEFKIYVLNKSDGTLAKTFTSPNQGTGAGSFGQHFGVTNDGKLIASEQDPNNDFSYMLLFKPSAGSVTVALENTLTNPDPDGSSADDRFGYSVGIHGDYAIVGAWGEGEVFDDESGKAYIYNVSDGSLAYTLDNPNAYSTTGGDRFGWAVDIASNYAIVGAYSEDDANGTQSGKAYIFNLSNGSLAYTLNNPAAGAEAQYGSSDDHFGYRVAISDTYAIVSAPQEWTAGDDPSFRASGKAYIYDLSNGNLAYTLHNPNAYGTTDYDRFGERVAISNSYAIVGTPAEDDAGGNNSGKAYIYDLSNGSLLYTLDNPNAYGTSGGDWFGYGVGINENYAVVGAYQEGDAQAVVSGKAYIYDLSDGSLLHTLDNPNPGGAGGSDQFGANVGVSDSYAFISASGEDVGSTNDAGKCYVYNLSDGTLVTTIDNPDLVNYNPFGDKDISITDTHAIVGAPYLSSNSGTAYIFSLTASSSSVVSNDITNFTVDTGGTFSADANGLRPHGSSVNNWYGNSGLSFNDDGTQMYWKETSSWYGFTLSTPYDTGTAVRDTSLDPYNYGQSNPFQFYSDHTYTVNYHTWSGDGRRYFLSGGSTKGAGWDIRTSDPDYSLDGVQNIGHDGSAETSYNFSFFSTFVPDALGNADNVMSNSNILFFNNDGTKLYMAKWESGYLSGYVTQYDLATPYTCDVSYAYGSFTSIHTQHLLTQPDATVTQGSQNENGTLEDVKWSSDGTKLFMLCESNIYDWVEGVETKRGPTIYQVDCSTPYDIATASYTQGNHIVLREAGVVTTGCYPSMAVEGNNIWVNVNAPTITGDSNTYTGRCLVKLTAPTPSGGSGGGSTIDQLTVSPNYTMSNLYANLGIGSTTFTWGDNGNIFMVSLIYNTGYYYYRFELTTPYDLTTATYAQTASQGWVGHGESVGFSDDGMKFYIQRQGAILQYDLSSAYSVGNYSGTYVAATLGTILATGSSYSDWFWNSDGTKIYVADSGARTFKEYTLSSAWEFSTASHTATYDFSTDIPSGTIKGMVGVSDLSKFYVLASTRIIYEFAMSSAGDITTTSLTASLDITNDISDPDHMKIKHDDTVLYIMGSGSELYTITL